MPAMDGRAIGGFAGLADSHHHPAPIGIFAGDCGFHQGRIGDGERDTPRGLGRRGAGHLYGDQLARTFAIARDLLGKVGHDAAKRTAKLP